MSQPFFDQLLNRLNLSVSDTNPEYDMGVSEVRERLKGVLKTPLSMTYGSDGAQVFHVNGRDITVPPMASDDDILNAVTANLNKIDEITSKPMSITGLQSGAFQAKLDEMRQKIADAQNQGLAKVEAAHAKAAGDIASAIDGVTAKIDKEVSDALQEFSTFTNGGPA